MGSIMARAYGDRIVILDVDLTRWLTNDTHRELEIITEGPGTNSGGWPSAERATNILTGYGYRVTGDWDRQWDNSRGIANGTLERDPGHLFAVVEQLDAAIEITAEQVKALRDEAGQAGDMAQVEICNAALEGDGTARAICENIIADAAAMGN